MYNEDGGREIGARHPLRIRRSRAVRGDSWPILDILLPPRQSRACLVTPTTIAAHRRKFLPQTYLVDVALRSQANENLELLNLHVHGVVILTKKHLRERTAKTTTTTRRKEHSLDTR